MMTTNQNTAPQFTNEILNVMNIQGYLVEYYIARGMDIEKAQDFAQEAVHKFMISPAIKPEYHAQYARLEAAQ